MVARPTTAGTARTPSKLSQSHKVFPANPVQPQYQYPAKISAMIAQTIMMLKITTRRLCFFHHGGCSGAIGVSPLCRGNESVFNDEKAVYLSGNLDVLEIYSRIIPESNDLLPVLDIPP